MDFLQENFWIPIQITQRWLPGDPDHQTINRTSIALLNKAILVLVMAGAGAKQAATYYLSSWWSEFIANGMAVEAYNFWDTKLLGQSYFAVSKHEINTRLDVQMIPVILCITVPYLGHTALEHEKLIP